MTNGNSRELMVMAAKQTHDKYRQCTDEARDCIGNGETKQARRWVAKANRFAQDISTFARELRVTVGELVDEIKLSEVTL
jgi:hypothetical protein